MKVLVAAPEVVPAVKVGGLADVVGSLPKEIASLGHDVRVVCPLYGCIASGRRGKPMCEPLPVYVGGQRHSARVWKSTLPDSSVILYLIEYERFFGRKEVYAGPWGDQPDNDQRFTFMCRASLDLCLYLGWFPDIVHCHDWTTGLIPVFLNTSLRNSPLGNAASVFTIHNLECQGLFSSAVIDFAQLPAETFQIDGLEFYGGTNFLKGALYHATKITTVSPTYAREIQTPEFGCGLESVLAFRAGDLMGVLNGIDTEVWNASRNPLLPATYHPRRWAGKKVCKEELQKRFELPVCVSSHVLGVVSRMYPQKGFDLLVQAFPALLDQFPLQLIVLGTGDVQVERLFENLAAKLPRNVGVSLSFDESLAPLIFAGADTLVMPSRFEPCGLSQMYAMAFGTPPILRATGGLADSVISYFDDPQAATGFAFEDPTPKALADILVRALNLYFGQPREFRRLQRNGMMRDSSWKSSAALYEDIYRWAIETRRSPHSG